MSILYVRDGATGSFIPIPAIMGNDGATGPAGTDGAVSPSSTPSATWNESVSGSGSVNKTIAHGLGAVPRRAVLHFMNAGYSAVVNVIYDGSAYYYRMSGVTYNTSASRLLSMPWVKSYVANSYLFGTFLASTSTYAGVSALSATGDLRLTDITFSASNITVSISNMGGSPVTLSTNVAAEVYE